MSRFRLSAAGALGLLAVCTVGCHLFGSGPTDQEVVAAIKKSPPSPPTVGPTYLAEVESVEVQERGRYNADGKYWPVRVRVKGGAKIKVTNVLQLGLLGDPDEAATESRRLRGGGPLRQGRLRELAGVVQLRPERPEVATEYGDVGQPSITQSRGRFGAYSAAYMSGLPVTARLARPCALQPNCNPRLKEADGFAPQCL